MTSLTRADWLVGRFVPQVKRKPSKCVPAKFNGLIKKMYLFLPITRWFKTPIRRAIPYGRRYALHRYGIIDLPFMWSVNHYRGRDNRLAPSRRHAHTDISYVLSSIRESKASYKQYVSRARRPRHRQPFSRMHYNICVCVCCTNEMK